ncbi:MAG: pilus assembly protein TadB [Aeromicrobium sp.]|nr:MAG: pilus assembly protein TadB [Aeromicrobium sp.]
MTGALLGAAFGAGLYLVVTGYRSVRKPSLESRVLPYLRDLPGNSHTRTTSSELSIVISARLRSLKESIGESVSGSAGVKRRLVRSGATATLAEFRTQQWQYGIVGFIVASAAGMLLWATMGLAPIGVLGLCLSGFIGGLYLADMRLTSAVNAYEAHMALEFPVIADLLALSVAAGESPLAAVERVVEASEGPLSRELARLIADVRSGGTTADAFESLSQRVGVGSVSRFAATMAVAIERGTPLIAVLHAQAEDAREASRRTLIETAGRREILMLMPVVFLVLPVVIVFAFYPGMIALSFVSGTP